jgi:hypothetical protein
MLAWYSSSLYRIDQCCSRDAADKRGLPGAFAQKNPATCRASKIDSVLDILLKLKLGNASVTNNPDFDPSIRRRPQTAAPEQR